MTLYVGEIIVLYLYLNYIVWGDILQILRFCTLISLNHNPQYLRIFWENMNAHVNYHPLLYLITSSDIIHVRREDYKNKIGNKSITMSVRF